MVSAGVRGVQLLLCLLVPRGQGSGRGLRGLDGSHCACWKPIGSSLGREGGAFSLEGKGAGAGGASRI